MLRGEALGRRTDGEMRRKGGEERDKTEKKETLPFLEKNCQNITSRKSISMPSTRGNRESKKEGRATKGMRRRIEGERAVVGCRDRDPLGTTDMNRP